MAEVKFKQFNVGNKKLNAMIAFNNVADSENFNLNVMTLFTKHIIINGVITYCKRLILKPDGDNFVLFVNDETNSVYKVCTVPFDPEKFAVHIVEHDLYVEVKIYEKWD